MPVNVSGLEFFDNTIDITARNKIGSPDTYYGIEWSNGSYPLPFIYLSDEAVSSFKAIKIDTNGDDFAEIDLSTSLVVSDGTYHTCTGLTAFANDLDNCVYYFIVNGRYESSLFRPVSASFIDEYQTVYDSWTTKPDASVANDQNTMVKGWVFSGVWAKKDVIYVPAVHTNDNDEALTNWKNPGTHDATIELNGGTMNFTAFEGFQSSDGAYLDSNYNPTSHAINYTSLSASISAYSRTNVSIDGASLGAYDSGTELSYMIIRDTNDDIVVLINAVGVSTLPTVTDSRGMFEGSRIGTTETNLYKNGVLLGTNTNSNTGIPDTNFAIMAMDRNGVITDNDTKQLSYADIGGGETTQNALNKTTYFEAYMDSNGKGVI